MTPTSCSHCGTPLPEGAAGHHQPDQCEACFSPTPNGQEPAAAGPVDRPKPPPPWARGARGVAAANALPAPPAPPAPSGPTSTPGLATRVRLFDGALIGLAAAAVAGVIWWGAVSVTERLIVYPAIVLGLLVGQSVLIGARRGGALPGLLAAGFTLVSLAVAQYFIERSLAISTRGAQDLPLWLGLSDARDIVRSSVQGEPINGAFWLLAAVFAAVSAGSSTRRPVV